MEVYVRHCRLLVVLQDAQDVKEENVCVSGWLPRPSLKGDGGSWASYQQRP